MKTLPNLFPNLKTLLTWEVVRCEQFTELGKEGESMKKEKKWLKMISDRQAIIKLGKIKKTSLSNAYV